MSMSFELQTEGGLFGGQLIGTVGSRNGIDTYEAVNPKSGHTLPGLFVDAEAGEIDDACAAAAAAFPAYAKLEPAKRAAFLRAIGRALDEIGEALTERAVQETRLRAARLEGETARTTAQLELFA
jgi:alpha-ketoglutaric semialdehyde dehydrogenase